MPLLARPGPALPLQELSQDGRRSTETTGAKYRLVCRTRRGRLRSPTALRPASVETLETLALPREPAECPVSSPQGHEKAWFALSYQSVDALQNALASTTFARTAAPKKAAGRALGTLVELITFYMVREWGLEGDLAIERGLPEYGNSNITHNVEYTLHGSKRIATGVLPHDGKTLTPIAIKRQIPALDLAGATLATGRSLLRGNTVRHACNIADSLDGFWSAVIVDDDHYAVSRHTKVPYAMFECKRVGIEEGQKKGPQTIEKAKQGAYVARSVSGLQRVPRRDGSVAAIVEEADGTLSTHLDYYEFLQGAIDRGDAKALHNVVLTVGVVSNHGNWFTAANHNKEMKVLAQSYDWLLFLTDAALAEFIETALHGDDPRFVATRAAFALSYSGTARSTTFTKVTMDLDADRELTKYFAETKPWERWFNVITPERPIATLAHDLHRLSELYGIE